MKCSKAEKPMKAARVAMKCSKAAKVAMKCSKAAEAMKAAKCSKAMKAAECSMVARAMNAVESSKAMKAMECSQAAGCSKDANTMKPTKRWTFLEPPLENAKFCDDESVEKDCYAIKDPTEHVEALGATITDATAEWEVIPLQVFFKNGRPREVQVFWLEKEQCRCLPRRTLVL